MAKKLTYEEETERLSAMHEPENEARREGFKIICGTDEAGRGPLAGPVCAAAVILPEGVLIRGLNDSKKLTPKRRDELFDEITKTALAYAVAFSDEKRIDEINILNASLEAMNKAVAALKIKPDFTLVDGNITRGLEFPCRAIVKGDSKSASIAAASVLAKVSRDRYMIKAAELYPEYGFEKHKGYGTKAHCEAILKYGPCPIHRRSFLTKLLGDDEL